MLCFKVGSITDLSITGLHRKAASQRGHLMGPQLIFLPLVRGSVICSCGLLWNYLPHFIPVLWRQKRYGRSNFLCILKSKINSCNNNDSNGIKSAAFLRTSHSRLGIQVLLLSSFYKWGNWDTVRDSKWSQSCVQTWIFLTSELTVLYCLSGAGVSQVPEKVESDP